MQLSDLILLGTLTLNNLVATSKSGNSGLSDYKFGKGEEKGKLISPLNSMPGIYELKDEESWAYGRMPEYLWIGLILNSLGRDVGLKTLHEILTKLHCLAPELLEAKMSKIIQLDSTVQKEFYDYLVSIGVKEALAPLTLFLTESIAPLFAESFYTIEQDFDTRRYNLEETMSNIMYHQSENATDVRYAALYFFMLSGHLHLKDQQIRQFVMYPKLAHSDEIMREIRPSVRSLEMLIFPPNKANITYIHDFWRCVSEMTECSLYAILFPKENRNIGPFVENLRTVFSHLSELFTALCPFDEKMTVLLGLSVYSYKRFKEIYDHDMFNSVAGRSCVRVLVEDYIIMKYLLKHENEHDNIWRDYQLYGLGKYELILQKHREFYSEDESHFDAEYIEDIVNEFKNEQFINIDFTYFDKQQIRQKAEDVGEKKLYDLYYDYESSFEHGLWGALRESAFLKCNNAAHGYHCVPDVDDEIVLKSALPDCVNIMKKTIELLNEQYSIPVSMLHEVINYELGPIAEQN